MVKGGTDSIITDGTDSMVTICRVGPIQWLPIVGWDQFNDHQLSSRTDSMVTNCWMGPIQ
jgi:hypothetical protein